MLFQFINLGENQIREVQKQSFKDLYLTNINISYNAIEKFEELSFENCVNITTLDLSYNRIVEFPRRTFDENSYTSELLLSHNWIFDVTTVSNFSRYF